MMSMVPNDKILKEICGDEFIQVDFEFFPPFNLHSQSMKEGGTHISCSTISPFTARDLSSRHEEMGRGYVSAPVLARPEGIEQKQVRLS